MPLRALALRLAHEWGQHPEDVFRKPGGLRWAAEWSVYEQERQAALEAKQRKPGG